MTKKELIEIIKDIPDEANIKIRIINESLFDSSTTYAPINGFYKYTCLNIIQANCTSLTRKDGNNIKYVAYKKKTK